MRRYVNGPAGGYFNGDGPIPWRRVQPLVLQAKNRESPQFALIPPLFVDLSPGYLSPFGILEADARQAADVFWVADEWGIESHGLARFHAYCEMPADGRINAVPKPRLLREHR